VTKKCTSFIEYCNSACPYFYHKYSDSENIYCDALNSKVADCDQNDNVMCDLKPRPIPDICPLDDASYHFVCEACKHKFSISRMKYENSKRITCPNCGVVGVGI
jgi:DNA-directed RNA polymerase subunit RPC12/RpoP